MSSMPGMELMIASWVAPTEHQAREFARMLDGILAAAKIRSPLYPGWYVGWSTMTNSCTTVLVFHVEPEAELPQP